MGHFVNTVERYRIRFFGRSTEGLKDIRAWLYLYGPGHETGVVGTIGFYPPKILATQRDKLDELGRPQGNMAVTELATVMDMLRNEHPIHVHWSDKWQQLWLDTEREPVGEGEAQGRPWNQL